MDKNNRVLVAVILLIFVTLLSFNLNTITGSLTKDKNVPYVSISPKLIDAGQRITVSVRTGKLGINDKACIYDDSSRKSCTNAVCDGNYKCYSTDKDPLKFNFGTSTSLEPGVHSVCVWDYELAQQKLDSGDHSQARGYICGDFTVKEDIVITKEIL